MSQNVIADMRAFSLSEEFKYLCENFDIIKDNPTNPSACNEALRAISGILNRCFDMKVTTTILDTRMDNEFFGVNIYPDFKVVRSIIDLTCDDNTDSEVNPIVVAKDLWRENNEWHIDFDAKLFYSLSNRFTPPEIAALLIHVIERTVFSFEIPHTVFRAVKHMMLRVDYRTLSISKSTICRNFYIIPFIQMCGFVNFKSDLPEGSLLLTDNNLNRAYMGCITKIATEFTSSIIDRPMSDLKQEVSYILTWVIEAINDLKYHMLLLKQSLERQIVAEKSFYVKNLLISIFKQFASHDVTDMTTESYLADTPERRILMEKQTNERIAKTFERVIEASQSQLLDKLGRCKRISQEQIDILRLEIEKINSVDDKVYYMEKVYDYLSIVNYALDLIGDRDTKGKVRDSKDKLLKQKEQLLQIREAIIAKKISPERYGLFIKYPAGYEG